MDRKKRYLQKRAAAVEDMKLLSDSLQSFPSIDKALKRLAEALIVALEKP